MTMLILQDGTTFEGQSFGAPLDSARDDTFGTGEVVFNTGMAGYPESMTDPSYRGQILVFTYPLIGNYGIPEEKLNRFGFSEHFESENIHVRAVICSQVSEDFSHYGATKSLAAWMEEHGIPGMTGVDTRALTKKLREHGVMLGRIVQEEKFSSSDEQNEESRGFSTLAFGERSKKTLEIEDPNLRNLVAEVSCKEVITYEPPSLDTSLAHRARDTRDDTVTIVAFDCGMKRNILRSFLRRGVRVIRVPWNHDLAKANFAYDGVFISNGPGDPKMCKETITQVAWAIERGIPTFGICLGIQIMALAIGGNTYKLKYGHRGANQPCLEQEPLDTRRRVIPSNPELAGGRIEGSAGATRGDTLQCIITSQNHGFVVEEKSLPAGWSVWMRNANDQTVEGIRHESGKFFAVQFHPEATPGPEDASYLFDEFLGVIRENKVVGVR